MLSIYKPSKFAMETAIAVLEMCQVGGEDCYKIPADSIDEDVFYGMITLLKSNEYILNGYIGKNDLMVYLLERKDFMLVKDTSFFEEKYAEVGRTFSKNWRASYEDYYNNIGDIAIFIDDILVSIKDKNLPYALSMYGTDFRWVEVVEK